MALLLCQFSSAQEAASSSKPEKELARAKKKFVPLGSFTDKRITESSGVAIARTAQGGQVSGSIWTFNDSGGKPRLFLVNSGGQTVATLKLEKANNRDWETMCRFAVGEDRFLAVGDVGDNLLKRKSCQIHVVPEPTIAAKISATGKLEIQQLKSEAVTIEFSWEDGPHNCEAMSYNAEDRAFWFVEKVYVDDKRKTPPGIFVLPDPQVAATSDSDQPAKNIARRVGDFPVRNVTGMAFSADNQQLVIRTYFGAWLFEKASGKSWLETVQDAKPQTLTLPLQSQGEAICFAADGKSLLLTSEFANAILWQVNLDEVRNKRKPD